MVSAGLKRPFSIERRANPYFAPFECDLYDPFSSELLHETSSYLHIYRTAQSERRDDPTYSRRRTYSPILAHLRPPVAPRDPAGRRPVVYIETEQVDGGREQLDGGGRGELRDRGAADLLLQLGAHARGEHGAEQRGDVEGGEDGEAVAQREQEVAGQRDGARGPAGAEHLDEDLVLVDAEADVGGGGGGELGGAGGDAGRGLAAEGRGRRVERVGREVGAAVQHEDEGDRLREEHRVRAREELAERGPEAAGEGVATGCVLHYRSTSGGGRKRLTNRFT